MKKSLFIIAPGPSINNQDLSLLKEENVMTLSGMYQHNDFKILNSKYHVLPRIFHHEKYNKKTELIANLKDIEKKVSTKTIICAAREDEEEFKKLKLFLNHRVLWRSYLPWDRFSFTIETIDINRIPSSQYLIESAIYISLYLEFENIFILGMDKNWLCENDLYAYFNNKKVLNKIIKKTNDYYLKEHHWDSEFRINALLQSIRKLKLLYTYKENIYNMNANQNTFVDVFPKIKYEEFMNGNRNLLIKNARSSFTKVPIRQRSKNHDLKYQFSSFYSNIFNKVSSFKKTKNKYVLYGYGSLGQTIYTLMEKNIVSILDINAKSINKNNVYLPERISSISYDYIIISTIAREEYISKMLIDNFNVKKDKIIIF